MNILTKEQAIKLLESVIDSLMMECDLDGKKIAIIVNKAMLNVMRHSWIDNEDVKICHRDFVRWFNITGEKK